MSKEMILKNEKANKKALFNAITNPNHNIGEMINLEFNVSKIIHTTATLLNEDTGEMEEKPRVVLFDENLESYASISTGVVNCVNNIESIYGTCDTWPDPIRVKVIQKETRNGNKTILLEIV